MTHPCDRDHNGGMRRCALYRDEPAAPGMMARYELCQHPAAMDGRTRGMAVVVAVEAFCAGMRRRNKDPWRAAA